jgi:hypothetical protein
MNFINLVSSIFILFAANSFTHIPFFDHYGKIHTIKLCVTGIVIFTLLKIATNVLFIKWGQDSIRTFKPIKAEIES